MKLDGDYIILEFETVFEGTDLATVSQSMRKIDTNFSDERQDQKDIQIVIDEN